jgi:hypothetical protein
MANLSAICGKVKIRDALLSRSQNHQDCRFDQVKEALHDTDSGSRWFR